MFVYSSYLFTVLCYKYYVFDSEGKSFPFLYSYSVKTMLFLLPLFRKVTLRTTPNNHATISCSKQHHIW